MTRRSTRKRGSVCVWRWRKRRQSRREGRGEGGDGGGEDEGWRREKAASVTGVSGKIQDDPGSGNMGE